MDELDKNQQKCHFDAKSCHICGEKFAYFKSVKKWTIEMEEQKAYRKELAKRKGNESEEKFDEFIWCHPPSGSLALKEKKIKMPPALF